jgi:hypothetical protein
LTEALVTAAAAARAPLAAKADSIVGGAVVFRLSGSTGFSPPASPMSAAADAGKTSADDRGF